VRTAGLLGITTFYLGMAGLIATVTTEEPEPRRLARLRAGCAAIAAVLVAGGPLGLDSGLALVAACVAFVLAVVSIWLASRRPAPLESYLEHLAVDADAAWRADFERPFQAYAESAKPPRRFG